jgi:hypothetical protein
MQPSLVDSCKARSTTSCALTPVMVVVLIGPPPPGC